LRILTEQPKICSPEVSEEEKPKGRKSFCVTCRQNFIAKNTRGKIPINCYSCRGKTFSEKQRDMNNIIRDFVSTPGNAIMCFKSGYLLVISGDRKESTIDVIDGIRRVQGR
jgi:hypothetical protein